MMPDDLWAKIREEAARETIHTGNYTSSSSLIRNAVTSYVNTSVDMRVTSESTEA